MWRLVTCLVLFSGLVTAAAQSDATSPATASCTFQDGKQISVRYQNAVIGAKEKGFEGKIWTPGNTPMLLFTQAKLTIGASEIPIGAYSMYLLPQKDHWTLVLNKNVTGAATYDEHQDLLRAEMQLGQLPEPYKQFSVLFGHAAAKQCNMRMYYGKAGSWLEIAEK